MQFQVKNTLKNNNYHTRKHQRMDTKCFFVLSTKFVGDC